MRSATTLATPVKDGGYNLQEGLPDATAASGVAMYYERTAFSDAGPTSAPVADLKPTVDSDIRVEGIPGRNRAPLPGQAEISTGSLKDLVVEGQSGQCRVPTDVDLVEAACQSVVCAR